MTIPVVVAAALAAWAVMLWAIGCAGRMSWRTSNTDRAAVIAVAVGSGGIGGYLLAGAFIPRLLLLVFFCGLAWWLVAPSWREWRRARRAGTAPPPTLHGL